MKMKMKKNRIKLNPNQIVGLIDSEGHFSFWIDTKTLSIIFLFKLSQREYSIDLLLAIKDYFNNQGEINIDNEKNGTLQYCIRNKKTLLQLIIPFLDQYPLLTSKYLDYQDFKLALNYENINKSKLEELIELKNQMNKSRSWESRYIWSKFSSSPDKITTGWIAGMVEGDGSLEWDRKNYRPTIQISQNSHDRPLLESLQKNLGIGYLKPQGYNLNLQETKNLRLKKNDFRITGNKAMRNVILPILNKYKFYSRKGVKLKLLNQLVEIFYEYSNQDQRNKLMSPLIEELQRKIPSTGNLSEWRKKEKRT